MPKTFADLVELMDRLRSPGGCPWDREQTYATLAPMLLEEAYEAFDALEEARQGRPDALREELGDLLFQTERDQMLQRQVERLYLRRRRERHGDADIGDIAECAAVKTAEPHHGGLKLVLGHPHRPQKILRP